MLCAVKLYFLNANSFVEDKHDFFFSLHLQEDGLNLLTIIKGTCKYRRSRRLDLVSDFLPPSMYEFKCAFGEVTG